MAMDNGLKCRVDHYFGIWLMDASLMGPYLDRMKQVDVLEAQKRFEDRKAKEKQQDDDAKKEGKPIRRYKLEDGAAIVQIQGPTTKYETKMSDVFGLDSTLVIQRAIRQAADDPDVKWMMLHVDSPGGMLDGTTELVDDLRRFNQKKPLLAHGDDHFTSASYLFGSQARRVTVNRTCSVGSIGTKAMLLNRSKQLEQQGIEAVPLSTGKYKQAGDPYIPMDADMRKYLQHRIERVNQSFLDDVSWARNTTPDVVKKMEARVYVGEDAVKAGLVDGVCAFDEAMAYARTNQITEPKRGRSVTYSIPATTGRHPARSGSMLEETTKQFVRSLPGGAGLPDEQLEGFMVQYNQDIQKQITGAQHHQAHVTGLPLQGRQGNTQTEGQQQPQQGLSTKLDDRTMNALLKAARTEVTMLESSGQITPAQRDYFIAQVEGPDKKGNPVMFTEQGGKYTYEIMLDTLKQGSKAMDVPPDGNGTTQAQPGNRATVYDPKKQGQNGQRDVDRDIIGKAVQSVLIGGYAPARQQERFANRRGVELPHALNPQT